MTSLKDNETISVTAVADALNILSNQEGGEKITILFSSSGVDSFASIYIDYSDGRGELLTGEESITCAYELWTLRQETTDPEKGAWLSLTLTVDRLGSWDLDVNWDEPIYVGFTPEAWFPMDGDFFDENRETIWSRNQYADDEKRHPRTEENIPDWMPTWE